MKKILITLLLLSATVAYARPYHSQQLKTPVQLLYQLDETKRLLAQVESQGPINIKEAHFRFANSNAAWISTERTIYLNFSKPRSLGSLVSSLVFEMHNVLSTRDFAHCDHLAEMGQLSKEDYIQAVEKIEYSNAVKTAQILQKGVRQRIFPPDSQWVIPNTFEEHYHMQVMAGHTDLIADNFEDIMRTAQRNNMR